MAHSADLPWGRVLAIWWAMIWRAFIVSAIVGAVAGGIAGGLYVIMGGSPSHSNTIGALAGYVVSIPISMWALRAGLRKQYRGFRIALITAV